MRLFELLLVVAWSCGAQTPPTSVDGAVLFHDYCAACHGLDGKGSGPMSASLKVAVPNLTTMSMRGRGRFPLERVERIISGEEALPAGHGAREMPVWGPVFSQIAWDRDLGRVRVHNLALYIEKMQAK